MMQTIACPVGKPAIPGERQQLLQGVKFMCPTGHATMSLAAESHDDVERAVTGYDKLKKQQELMK